tara:strand:- start:2289 stop:2681 length:393 start_codon:yes stop_codon:yes gene_type:complete
MINKITHLDNLKGIRISNNAFFIKKIYLRKNIKYLYKNVITITNKSKNTIQIISKHKKILELFGVKKLNPILKQKPIIKPGKKITLNLNCSTKSKIATLMGYFSIISLNNSTKFKAYIPQTKLSLPEILN